MMTAPAKSRPRPGAAAVEFALLSPLLLVLLLGLWEVGRMVEAQQVINNAAREGARQGSTGKKSADEVKADVIRYLKASDVNTTGIVVSISKATTDSEGVTTWTTNADPREYKHLDHFKIEVSLPFNNVRWILLNRFNTDPQSGFAEINPPQNLTAESHWYSMKDEVLTVSFLPPIE